jgi:membrane protein
VDEEPQQRPTLGSRVLRAGYRWLWGIDDRLLSPWARWGVRVARLAFLTLTSFFRERIQTRASALAFVTLLAIVPTAALAFSLADIFGLTDQLIEGTLRPLLAETFAITSADAAPDGLVWMQSTLDQLLDNVAAVDVFSLGVVGAIFTLVAIGRVLIGTEEAFDAIWGFPSHRPLHHSVLRFLAVFLLTPTTLVASTFLTAARQQHELMEWVRSVTHLPVLIDNLAFFVPPVLVCVGLLPAYLLLPSAHVRLRSAVVGALVGGLGWYGLQVAHVRFQIGLAGYDAFYSGFGAFPIFLIWLQLAWTFVLMGATAAAAHQNAPTLQQLTRGRLRDHFSRQAAALRAMVELTATPEGRRLRALAVSMGVAVEPLREVLDALVASRLLESRGRGFDPVYATREDPAHIRVTTVLDAIEHEPTSSGSFEMPDELRTDAEVLEVIAALNQAADASEDNRTIAELTARLGAEEPSVSPEA